MLKSAAIFTAGILVSLLVTSTFQPAKSAAGEYAQTGDFQIVCHPYSMAGTYLIDTKAGRSWVMTKSSQGGELYWQQIDRR